MEGGQMQLRDRMLRDAIVEVLRSTVVVTGDGEPIPLVDSGLIGHVTVDGDRVRLEVSLPSQSSPFGHALAAELRRRVQALPEVTLIEVSINAV